MAIQYKEHGVVTKIKGCIVALVGLDNCINGQLVRFGYGTEGVIIGFDEEETQILLVKEKGSLKTGDKATMTLEPFNTPVGENFIGRVVNVLGEPLDNLEPLIHKEYYPIFGKSPSVLEREIVKDTVETGIKILDTMIPIGRGQRQLILGDKMTGKTAVGTDIILNQKGKDVKCIYCCIGKGKAALDRVVSLFKERGAFEYTTIVAAMAGTSPGQQYLAPYISCSIGEYFVHRGGNVIVVFDDFTKHAWAYREISLLLDRPPGRESYPGDIFYLHSRMIERAAKYSKELGGGSMTFFPIIELLEGDLTGYVSTNLVSMTDGQIYLSTALFGEGFKPAIDIGLSVSRIGSKVQWKAMKKLSKSLRLEYLQFREMLKISRLKASGAKSEEAVEQQKGGEILSELLKQGKDAPINMVEEVLLFFGLAKKLVYDLDNEQIKKMKTEIYDYAKERCQEALDKLDETHDLTDDIEEAFTKVYKEYVKKCEREKIEQEKALAAQAANSEE
ncbi:MAG: F0F1 ATP synthase subunit alpha [Candidatus Omnitrophica bacterium]|nr:F0F1 ATP synthase subunit alpha [Candidatus Omnitrophota bacterium]MDD5081220.1 F0F1 ATP synthase subunit alpha [Candidatus Omnitrophota bacterium]MDD5441548.1 F0F1 ATP synthase subunit alpha [Candidatus Omnitrophota bacterium]